MQQWQMLGNNENAVERYGEKGQFFRGENKDSYTNQLLTGVHGSSLTGVHGNTNRTFENNWKSQKSI